MSSSSLPSIGELLSILPEIRAQHARSNPVWKYLDQVAKTTVAQSTLTRDDGTPTDLGVFGTLNFPYTKMGNIDSLDLFGLDELIIFSFYWSARKHYKRAADIGGNIGLHSLLMARAGLELVTYEPDPTHAKWLRRNLANNDIKTVTLHEAAVSDKVGTLEFVRVLGNTTSSHLAGSKSNAYGDLERFPVRVETIQNIAPHVDFIKVDAEGQERYIVPAISAKDWDHLDMMLEVGTPENAVVIYDFISASGLHAFAQKLGWSEVKSLADMPSTYKEGSLFLSRKSEMPWK